MHTSIALTFLATSLFVPLLSGCGDSAKSTAPTEHAGSATATMPDEGRPAPLENLSVEPTTYAPEPPQLFEGGTKGLVANCPPDVFLCNDSLVTIKNPSGVQDGNRVRAFNSQCYLPDGGVVEVVVHNEGDVLVHIQSVPSLGRWELGDVSVTDICPASNSTRRVLLHTSAISFSAMAEDYTAQERAAAEKREQDAAERKLIEDLLALEKKQRNK